MTSNIPQPRSNDFHSESDFVSSSHLELLEHPRALKPRKGAHVDLVPSILIKLVYVRKKRGRRLTRFRPAQCLDYAISC